MQHNVLWTGREYYSLENCLVDVRTSGADITSTIIGLYQGTLYQVEYRIQTNQKWETVLVDIRSRHSNQTQLLRLESLRKGQWRCNGEKAGQFEGCLDVDIPLTPFHQYVANQTSAVGA